MKRQLIHLLMAASAMGAVGVSSAVIASAESTSIQVEAEKSAAEWLELMQKAAMTTNYKGTFVFTRGNSPSTVRIFHRFKDGIEHERLTQLDGEMGEIIRTGGSVMCVLPGNRIVQTEKPDFSSSVVESFAEFNPGSGMYNVSVVGYERLIDRKTVKIAIEALDKNRHSYFLWQDKETGLLLKSSMMNYKGEELERFQFSQLEYVPDIEDSVFEVVPEGEPEFHTTIPMVVKDYSWPGEMDWDVSWMPKGFEALNPNRSSGQNVMVYSDGLASFSVFVEPVESNSMPLGAAAAGGTVAYFHKVVTGKHHYGVTVMGEIPAKTAMLVAESVKPMMANQ